MEVESSVRTRSVNVDECELRTLSEWNKMTVSRADSVCSFESIVYAEKGEEIGEKNASLPVCMGKEGSGMIV